MQNYLYLNGSCQLLDIIERKCMMVNLHIYAQKQTEKMKFLSVIYISIHEKGQ